MITASWSNKNLDLFGNRLGVLNATLPKVLPRVINQVGDRGKTQVGRVLSKQTGLPAKTTRKAVSKKVARAHTGKLSYDITVAGGDVRLEFFAPRETRKGVSAKPWGRRSVFADTFTRGGRFPNRVQTAELSPHVWRRLDKAGTRITQARSGLYIPAEAVQGATAKAWTGTGPLLKQRVDAALNKLIP